MKPHSKLVFASFALLAVAGPLTASAEPPIQVNACVEVYQVSQTQSMAIQKVFSQGSDTERVNLLLTLHKSPPAVARVITVCQGSCPLGQRSVIISVREYRYGTRFRTENGVDIPTAFETRDIGCTMELEVSLGEKEGTFSILAGIASTELASPASRVDSKGEQQRGSKPPVFTTAEIKTQLQMVAGIPKLIGTYAPYKQDKAASDLTADVLRLVVLTIRPEK